MVSRCSQAPWALAAVGTGAGSAGAGAEEGHPSHVAEIHCHGRGHTDEHRLLCLQGLHPPSVCASSFLPQPGPAPIFVGLVPQLPPTPPRACPPQSSQERASVST